MKALSTAFAILAIGFVSGCSGSFEQPAGDLGGAGCQGGACADGSRGSQDGGSGGDVEANAGHSIPECGDGIDNDGDGLIDLEDDQCDSVLDAVEGEEPATDRPTETGWTVVQRTNFGGPAVDGAPAWEADNEATPTTYIVDGTMSFGTLPGNAPSLVVDDTVPEETPIEVFTTTRFDQSPDTGGGMSYAYPADAGQWRVRLHFVELWTGAHQVGVRRFDVVIAGELVLENYDIYADVGAFTATTRTFDVELSADGTLEVEFLHVDGGNNPYVAAIELLRK